MIMPVSSNLSGLLSYLFWIETVSPMLVGFSSLVWLSSSFPRVIWRFAIIASCCLRSLVHLASTLCWPGLIGMRSLIFLPNRKSLLDMEVLGSGLFRCVSSAARNLSVSRVPNLKARHGKWLGRCCGLAGGYLSAGLAFLPDSLDVSVHSWPEHRLPSSCPHPVEASVGTKGSVINGATNSSFVF